MATKDRPGVKVIQEVTPAPPAVVEPPLNPCIVGPCYAITEPLTSTGALDSNAQIKTPARVESASTFGDVLAVAAAFMGISVDNGDIVVFQLPAVAVGSNLNVSEIPQAIMAKVTGLSAKLDGSTGAWTLVLTSKTTGSGSKIRLWSNAELVALGLLTGGETMAYTLLNINASVGIETIVGRDNYSNKKMTIPYELLPTLSHHPDADELVFDDEDMETHRYWAGKLTKMEKKAATNWTSLLSYRTDIGSIDTSTSFGPITAARDSLWSKDGVGGKTNKVSHLGRDASTYIPLALSNAAGKYDYLADAELWPDASGLNYLYFEAMGAQNYKLDRTANVGPKAGETGNDVVISFNEGAGPSVSWANPVLTINYIKGTTTRTAMKALIDADADVATNFYKADLIFEDGEGAALMDKNGDLNGKTFNLSGGINPVNFGTDGTDNAAIVVGAINNAVVDPVSLLAGKSITIAVNGGEPVTVAMPTGTPTSAQLATDIVAAFPGGELLAVANQAIASKHDDSTTGTALKLTAVASGADDHHDCTIELGGDQEALDLLFGGYLTRTDTVTGLPTGTVNYSGGDAITQGSGTKKYNALADTELDKAIKPNSVTVLIENAQLHAYIASGEIETNAGGDFMVTAGLGPHNLTLQHSGFHPNGGSLGDKFTINFTAGAATVASFASAINTQLGLAAGDGVTPAADTFIEALDIRETHNTSNHHLVFRDKRPSAAKGTIRLWDSFANGTAGSSTDDAFADEFKGSRSDVFDTDATSVDGSVSVADKPLRTLMPMTATPSTAYPGSTDFEIIDDGAVISEVIYDIGTITLLLESTLVQTTASSTVKVTYTRGAANFVTREVLDYSSNIHFGQSRQIKSGDKLYNNGEVIATVLSIESNAPTGAPAGWGTNNTMVLSTEAVDKASSLADWYIRAQNLPTTGTSRPAPEVIYDDTAKTISLKHNVNRGPNGIPMAGTSNLYADYRALRLDVTADATNPGLLVFKDSEDVDDQIGPISTRNPLAFALNLAFQNAQTIEIRALGVGATSANSPNGTVDAYDTALNYLEKHSVWGLAPLSQDPQVHQLFYSHVKAMVADGKGGERSAYVCPKLPTEEASTLVGSAASVTVSEVSSGVWDFEFGSDTNFAGLLSGKKDANGTAIATAIGSTYTAENGIYITRTGDPHKYLVTKLVSASSLQVKTNYVFDATSGPGTGGNDDAYYIESDTKLDTFPSSGETCTVQIRNVAIATTTTAGKNKQMEALKAIGEAYADRRFKVKQPESVATTVDGLETIVPGFYHCAVTAAMRGQYNPSQPFTNLPISGFTRPIGSSDKFTESQMATAAAGGIWWDIQDSPGEPLKSRHQLTTDLTSIKTQEDSVTSALDALSFRVREAIKRYIGRYNITKGLLRQLGITLTSVLAGATGDIVADAELVSIEVKESALDEIAVKVNVTPFYPANTIEVTIVV